MFGSFMVDIQGTVLTQQERERLCHPLICGVILFTRNFQSLPQLETLIASIHELPRKNRLLIAVDQEGGRVQRFQMDFTKLPAMRTFGTLYDQDPEQALQLTEQCGWLMASELVSVGVDLSFAPVLDLDVGISQVIGNRAFHRDPHVVAELAAHFVQGMNRAGMCATGKHFPGHGSVEADSHHAIVVDARQGDEVFTQDLIPFIKLIVKNLSAVMTAHVIYPELDGNPAGFSTYWLQEILRKSLAFEGVIFSDDIQMHGAHLWSDPAQRARVAIEAGCDIILSCNHPDTTFDMIVALDKANLKPADETWAKLYAKPFENRSKLLQSPSWETAKAQILPLTCG